MKLYYCDNCKGVCITHRETMIETHEIVYSIHYEEFKGNTECYLDEVDDIYIDGEPDPSIKPMCNICLKEMIKQVEVSKNGIKILIDIAHKLDKWNTIPARINFDGNTYKELSDTDIKMIAIKLKLGEYL